MINPSRKLISWIRPYRRSLLTGILWLVITQLLDKSVPLLLRAGIDSLSNKRFSTVIKMAIAIIVISAVMWVVRTWSRMRIFQVGRDVEYDIRISLLQKMHTLGVSFFQKMSTGELMSRATNDLAQVRLLVGFGILNTVNSIFAYGGAIILMFTISPELTAIAMIPYPFFLVITRTFSKRLYASSQEAQSALGALSDGAQETLLGIRLVRAFAIEERAIKQFETINERALRSNMKLVVLRGWMWPMLTLIGSLGTLLVVWRGGTMILEHRLTPGSLAAFIAYLGQLTWPTLALGYLLAVVQRGRASYKRITDIFDADPDIIEAPDAIDPHGQGALRIAHLTMKRGEDIILHDISFDLPAKTSLAVIGGVGSGKSTLAALLPRLLSTPEASVYLDEVDITKLKLKGLRHAVGYAAQDPFLFSTTVEQNIALALDHRDTKEAYDKVEKAAEEASILDEIKALPHGFQTVVGERGVQLSGGQKQRIALARALAADPQVLVLDDPLSAVDARTETHILNAIDRAAKGRTLILVTHRARAAARMDQVIVLEKGRIIEQGKPDELMNSGGYFERLMKQQALEQELSS